MSAAAAHCWLSIVAVTEFTIRKRTAKFIEPTSRQASADSASPGKASRWWLVGGIVVSLIAVIPQAFGRQFVDTKLDLTTSPVSLLSHLLNLWDPNGWFGFLQDQYQGYAFPIAPFFALGHLLLVPPWITERLWMALLLATAFWGLVRLCEALEIGSLPTRIAGGFAFALWPLFTILVGVNSSALAPGVLLPWVLVPLVKGVRGGSTIRAAALSALAVLFIGGVNAADTLDVLLVPALFLLTRERSPRRRSLICWWVVCVGLATMWWLIPLLFLGKYGFNFLPYTEQAAVTTSTMSAPAALQGTGDWIAYLSFGNQLWDPGGSILVSYPVVILGSATTVALGLFGLARKDLRERRFLLLTFAMGIMLAASAYWGPFGGPLGHVLRPLLNGTLAPFRNVYKFEPLLALPIVLGIVHGLQVLRLHLKTVVSVVAVSVLSIACLATLASPYLLGQVSTPKSFNSIPNYWYQTADYLAKHAPHTTALVVPASAHGLYTWGWTIDQPLEALATSPWVDREIAPYSGAASTRVVDAVDEALRTGQVQPGLDALLQRSGISYVVVQNDTEWQLSDSPSPYIINRVLSSAGLSLATTFGPTIQTYGGNNPTLTVLTGGYTVPYPTIQIYKVGGPNTPVATFATKTAVLASGGPEADLQLFNQGIIKTNQAVVLAGNWQNSSPYEGPLFAITDTLRRENNDYGLVNDNFSYTLTPKELAQPNTSSPDGMQPPRQMLPFPGLRHQTTAEFTGAASVEASSYGSWVLSLPEYNPANVFDDNSSTGWAAGSPNGSIGQWIEVDFNKPRRVTGSSIKLLTSGNRPIATEVEVSTNKGAVLDRLTPSDAQQKLRTPRGDAAWLRVTFVNIARGQFGEAGIEQIAIPGLHVQPYLKPPQEQIGAGAQRTVYSFQTTQVDPSAILRSAPEPVLARVFSVPKSSNLTITGTAQPVAGADLDRLLQNSSLQVTASSTFGNLPSLRPDNLVDQDLQTEWIASTRQASLTMTWPKTQKLNQLSVVFAPSQLAAKPEEILIKSLGGTRLLHLNTSGGADVVHFTPLETNRIQVSFPKVQLQESRNALGSETPAPVGLAELEFPALAQYERHAVDPATVFVRLCGSGPPITVDGRMYPTYLWGTYGELYELQPLQFETCQPNQAGLSHQSVTPFLPMIVHLSDGQHHVLTTPSINFRIPFLVSGLTMSTSGSNESVGRPRFASVLTWGAENRSVRVGAGARTYLEVHQNYNTGWVATMDGTQLTAVILDGWQQGYVIPGGSGGVVRMTFKPESAYLLGLFVGAMGVLALLLLAVLAYRPSNRLGRWGSKLEPAKPWRRPIAHWITAGLCLAVIFAVGSSAALVVIPLLIVGWLWPRTLPWIALFAMLGVGAISAVDVGNGAQSGIGAFGPLAQLAALVAIAAVLTPTRDPSARDASGSRDDHTHRDLDEMGFLAASTSGVKS